jgi:FlaA1/EpsC-like NDP-sugar epimerase
MEMTRFFITLEDACESIYLLLTGSYEPHKVYVPKKSLTSYEILNVVETYCAVTKRKIQGALGQMRPSEKIHETLASANENYVEVPHFLQVQLATQEGIAYKSDGHLGTKDSIIQLIHSIKRSI